MDVNEAEKRSLVEFLRGQAQKRSVINKRMQNARQLIKRELDRIERQARKNLVLEKD